MREKKCTNNYETLITLYFFNEYEYNFIRLTVQPWPKLLWWKFKVRIRGLKQQHCPRDFGISMSEEQNTSCQDDSGHESDNSPLPQSQTSVSPKPDNQHPDDTRPNSIMTSSPHPSLDHARFKSSLERFRVDQGNVVISEKGTHICQQQIARNPGSKSKRTKF